jgi:WD40-like Beta Propeller Repeat
LRGESWLAFGLLVLAAAVLPACNDIINYPSPRIATLNPTSINAGQEQFTLTVTGFQFAPASSVEWNGTPLVTFFQTGNELTALVPTSLIETPGTVPVTVFTPQPGGGTSTSLFFTVNPITTPVPKITGISPTGVLAGSSAFQLYITGANFVSSSTVTVNGDNRPANFVDSANLNVQITAAEVATAGTVQIAVLNPIGPSSAPGGGSSSPVSLVVTNPVPTLSSLSPANLGAGTTSDTTLTVNGSSLVPSSVIEIDGGARSTTFGGTSQVSTTLTPGDLAAAGVHTVQVVNPDPGGGSSNIMTYAVDPTLTYGLPELLDYGLYGAEANQGICGQNCATGPPTLTSAGPGISSNGSTVVFASTSTNFFLNQSNTGSDVYTRTTCVTSTTCTPTTTIVSIGLNKTPSNGSSYEPSMDSAAAHAALTSTASNLVGGVSIPPSGRQVYWMPICASTTTTCSAGELVSLSADGTSTGNGDSYNPSISPDGRYVAFVSLATTLVSGLTLDGKTPQVFLRDTCGVVATSTSGSTCTPTTVLISTPDGVTPGNAPSSQPNVANDGAYVSFTSAATNLGATAPNPNGAQEIFVRTVCLPTVTSCTGVTSLVSTPDGVTPANGSSSESKIASTGRFIVFASTATNLATGAGPVQQVYLFDTCLNAVTTCVPGATLLSTADGTTPGNAISEYPSVTLGTTTVTATSTAGQLTAFASRASNLGANTQNGVENIFVRKTCIGFTSTTTTCTPVTVVASQAAGTSPPQANGDSLMPAISGDAHTVAFISSANNLVVPATTNNFANVFLALTSF